MKILSFDELLILSDQVKCDDCRMSRMRTMFFICIIPFVVIAILDGSVNILAKLGCVLIGLYMLYNTFWLFWAIHRQSVLFDNIQHRTLSIPYSHIYKAECWYGGRWVDYSMAAIECWECHIPNDCPLCGAE